MITLGFWFVVIMTIAAAVVVVGSRNLVYSAVGLFFTLFGIAGLYVFLWADFMAGVQVMVYVGGILVLILFGIMLTHRISSVNISHTGLQRSLGVLVAMVILFGLTYLIQNTPWKWAAGIEPESTTYEIGTLIMTDYLLPFEVASVLLLAALIGAAVLSRKNP